MPPERTGFMGSKNKTIRHGEPSAASRHDLKRDRRAMDGPRDAVAEDGWLRTLFEESPDGMLLVNLETLEIVEFNEAAHRQLGYTREEFARLGIQDYEAVDTPEEISGRAEKIKREGRAEFETLHRSKSGELRNVNVWIKLIDIGEKKYFYSIVRDITAKKRLAERLWESEARSRLIAENINDALLIHDLDGHVTDLNTNACRLTGYGPEEIKAGGIQLFWSEETAERHSARVVRLLENGAVSFETVFIAKDGSRIPVEISASLVSSDGSGVVHALLRDVSERRKAEDALRESRESLRQRTVELEKFASELENRVREEVSLRLGAEEYKNLLTDYASENSSPDLLTFAAATLAARTGSAFGFCNLSKAMEHIDPLKQRVDEELHSARVSAGTGPKGYLANERACFDCNADKCQTGTDGIIPNGYTILMAAGLPEIKRVICTPIIRDGETVAIFGVANKAAGYEEDDLKQLRRLAEHAWDAFERKLYQERLAVSERLYRLMFETVNEGIFVLDAVDKVSLVNGKLCEMLSLEPGDLLGKPAADMVCPEDRDGFLNYDAKRKYDLPATYQLRMTAGGGKKVWVHVKESPLYDGEKNFIGILSMVEDITERLGKEQALIKTEATLRAITDSTSDFILAVDPETLKIFHSNKAAGKYLKERHPEGHEAEEDFFESLPDPEDRELWTGRINKALADGEYECEHFARGGRVYKFTFNTMRDGQSVFGIAVFGREITDEKKALEKIQRLAKAVEQSTDEIVITDVRGAIQYVNPAVENNYGIPLADMIGKTPRIFKSGIHSPAFYRTMWKTLKNGEKWQGKITNRKRNGELIHLDVSMAPLTDEHGNLVSFISVRRDVTSETAMEKRLAQSDKLEAIGTLAGGIAHDFNNILSAILGYTAMAIEDLGDSEPNIAKYLNLIKNASKRAASLVNQILVFSRGSSKERNLVILKPLIKEILQFLVASLPPDIILKSELGTDRAIVASPTEIHQIIMNLSVNAVQAMADKGGTLTISLQETVLEAGEDGEDGRTGGLAPGKYIELEVADTGCGIPEDVIPYIFDPFYTKRSQGEGTGLGLSVVYGIVKDYKGSISVESKPERGAKFTILLPIDSEGEPEKDSDEHTTVSGEARILMVDDEEILIEMFTEILRRHGYDATGFTDPEAALAEFKANPDKYDLVISDYKMPTLRGTELVSELRKINGTIPIIMMTGFTQWVERDIAEAWGIKHILKKPVTLEALTSAISDLFRKG